MKRRITSGLIVSFISLAAAATAGAQEAPKAPASDNTKVNKRDRAASQRTADQAKETTSDRDIMQKIRKAIVEDKSLSTYAHNIKVISEHGKVTLKGPVHSEEERKAIEEKAVEVAGSGNVTNRISVKGDKASIKKKSAA
jgi:osmotically-inducible protein OsmY